MKMKHMLCALLAALMLSACAQAEASIGIIGGADGPTAVFVTQGEPGEIVEIVGPVTSAEVTAEPEAKDAQAEASATAGVAASPKASAKAGVATSPKASAAAGAQPTPEISATASAEPTPEPTEVPRLHGLRIGIDPGHQEHANSEQEPVSPDSSETKAKVASGTSGRSTGIPEYVTDLEIALKLRDALEAQGCTVYMTREINDVDISNLERAQMMNELGVDLVLRIHCDGAEDRSANGIGMFVRKTGEKQAESEAAAEVLLDAMVEATGAKRRGVYLRDTYTMNNWSTVPCILVECGFMSNPEEDEKLNDPAYQELLAQGMVEGIARYFER